MASDDADFSGETTGAVEQWKHWILKRIEELGSGTGGTDDEKAAAVEHIRDLLKGAKAAEEELRRRGAM